MEGQARTTPARRTIVRFMGEVPFVRPKAACSGGQREVPARSQPARPAPDPTELARRLEGAGDKRLAEALDAAEFDRSWPRVNGVARALRARVAPKPVDPLSGLAAAAVVGSQATVVPLVALQLEVARRR